MTKSVIELGQVVATPGALRALETADAGPFTGLLLLARHQAGDWGNVDAEDRSANDRAVTTGDRILSAYVLDDGTKLWIITERDRSVTTILLPEEY
jgi:hypothetical protein